MSINSVLNHTFLKSVTQSCPPSGTIIRISCHWLTHSFKILACLLLADTIVSCQSVSQLSHQPRSVHWTYSVATCVVQSSGTNFPSHFVPKIESVKFESTFNHYCKIFANLRFQLYTHTTAPPSVSRGHCGARLSIQKILMVE